MSLIPHPRESLSKKNRMILHKSTDGIEVESDSYNNLNMNQREKPSHPSNQYI